MIEMDKVVKRYKDVIALDYYSFLAGQNEIIGLLGLNVCGKTTSINCMHSLVNFEKSSINIFGMHVNPINNKTKHLIGIVPKELAIFEKLNVVENNDFYCGMYVNDRRKRKQLVDEAIDFVVLEK